MCRFYARLSHNRMLGLPIYFINFMMPQAVQNHAPPIQAGTELQKFILNQILQPNQFDTVFRRGLLNLGGYGD